MAVSKAQRDHPQWLDEASLKQLASIASNSPDEFDERFRGLDLMQRIQVRRFLFEQHKKGAPLPPSFKTSRSREAPSETRPATANTEAAETTVEEAGSLDDLFSQDAGAETATAGSDGDEVAALDALFSSQDDVETTTETASGEEGDAFSLDDLFAASEEEESEEVATLDETTAEAEQVETVDSDYGVPIPVEISTDEICARIQALTLFNDIDMDGLQAIAAEMDAVQYAPGEIICKDGDQGDAMYFIMEGSVRVLPGGKDLGIVVPAGTSVGEMSLLDGSPRSATLAAEGTTVLLRLFVDGYTELFHRSPKTGLTLTRNLARMQQDRIRETNAKAIAEAEAAARLGAEMKQAEDTQKLALPDHLPTFGDSEFFVSFTAARGVSGDYYDFIEFEDDPDKLILIFGDSTGHGLNAGLLMLLAKSASFTQKQIDPSVTAITAAINNIICEVFTATLFMTFVCCLIDRKKGTIEYTNAGQQSHPYLYRIGTDEFVALESQTFQLGIQANATYSSETITYAPGDLLVCYSDGIIEAPYCPPGADAVDRTKEFGDERLRKLIRESADRTPEELVQRLLDEARAFCQFYDGHAIVGGEEHDGDDITNVVIRLK